MLRPGLNGPGSRKRKGRQAEYGLPQGQRYRSPGYRGGLPPYLNRDGGDTNEGGTASFDDLSPLRREVMSFLRHCGIVD